MCSPIRAVKHIAIERSTEPRPRATFERVLEQDVESEGKNTTQRQDLRFEKSARLVKLIISDGLSDFATIRHLCLFV